MADPIRKSSTNRLASMLTRINQHSTTPLTHQEAVCLSNQWKTIMEKCEEAHDAAIGTCTTDAAILVQDNAQDIVTTAATEVWGKLQDIIIALTPAAAPPPPPKVSVKLPTLELPVFDGSFANWLSFKDLFMATVDKHPDLSQSQKLQYLKLKLAEEPANIIKSLLMTNANHQEAWTLLDARYNNLRQIVYTWVDKLLHQPKALSSESATGLQALIDNTNECIRSLEVLKIDTKSWDPILISCLLRKVDPNTRCEWATRRTGTSLPTYVEFSTFVNNHIRGLIAKGSVTPTPAPPQKRKPDNRVKSHTATTNQQQCFICKGPHLIYGCDTFKDKSPKERSQVARTKELCFNCLSSKHRIGECASKSRCRKCNSKHHTLLHEDRPPAGRGNNSQRDAPAQPENVQSNMSMSTTESQVLLSTAIVLVEDQYGVKQPCRAFLDSGSQASFVAEDCVQRLGLPRSQSNIRVSGISAASVGSSNGKVLAKLFPRQQASPSVAMDLHILPRVTGDLPRFQCSNQHWPHLQGIQLADQEYHQPSRINILIGADYHGSIMLPGQRAAPTPDVPYAQETIFGWVLIGRVPLEAHHTIEVHHAATECDILRKFWEVEEPPRTRILTMEEKEWEAHFQRNYRRDKEGRFTAAIPFNSRRSELGYSKSTAIGRFNSVEKRLQRLPQHKDQDLDFMEEYQTLGHMEKVPLDERDDKPGTTFYLPHHFVVNESSSTTKLRVVFDGSVKSSTGISLNEAMMVGATLQDELYLQLLRFRSHPIVVKADIAKMFRQFKLSKSDADMHRILWRKSPSLSLEEFRLTTITYGTACAPNLTTRCLQQLAMDVKDELPLASTALLEDTYVDDVMSGTRTPAEAIILYKELIQATSTAGMELRKWSSNSPEVLEAIPDSQHETDPQSFDEDSSVKALGIQWHPSLDTFKFNHIPITECPALTKRVLLSDLARVFDPLGLISCITVRAKIILQELWKDGIEWDAPIPDEINEKWIEYQKDMERIPELSIPRCIHPSIPTHQELHGFSDASEKAYGAVIYLRSFLQDGSINVRLITSKSKVAPVRQVTVPRLELMAAVLLAELIVQVQESLKLQNPFTLWTDSTITLRWISAQSKRWKTFVANRVAAIQESTPIECWRHVPGVENPADLPSRGVSVEEVATSPMWLSGPDFLRLPTLPIFPFQISQPSKEDEERNKKVLAAPTYVDYPLIEKFSCLIRLKRVTAYLLRFIHNCRPANSQRKQSGRLSVYELETALITWIKLTQLQHYKAELKVLENREEYESIRGKKANLPHSSKLRTLHPFLDNRGVMRVSGRLQHSSLPDDRKHQIILPVSCHLTELLISHAHLRTLHGGFQLTWSQLLSQYWIPSGRNRVRLYVRSCVICIKWRAKAAEQFMGSLPAPRVTQSRPFSHTGVDYTGSLSLKNPVGRVPQTYKGDICIFVCMATKAVHLEAVSSSTTEDFLAALRRFSARRGCPSHIYSDQETNFVGADKELRRILQSLKSSATLSDALTTQSITWHWNPAHCAHAGGLWEAAVKSTKHHLRRVVGNAVLTYEQLCTILCQIEGILNSRPLFPHSADPDDTTALTPGHFLNLHPIVPVPDADLSHLPINRLNLYQKQQQRVQQFWKLWSRDYLNTLQQRNKWWWEKPNLAEGDLVLDVEPTAPGTWKMARVTKLHRGEDNLVRVVTIKMVKDYLVEGKQATTHYYDRPIVKLIPLFNDEN